jgi:hypothetical protein
MSNKTKCLAAIRKSDWLASVRGNITEDYAKEMAKSLCTQLHGTLNPAYLKCDDYNHHDVQCACKEVYDETLNTHDGTLEKYLACKIYEFIEKI